MSTDPSAGESLREPLLGLPNRRALEREFQRLKHAGEGLALIYLDVDGFVYLNHWLGHDAGDTYLCDLLGQLQQSLEPKEFLARIGGDDFAILRPGANLAVAVARANAFREKAKTLDTIRDMRCVVRGGSIRQARRCEVPTMFLRVFGWSGGQGRN
jgi:diguanylate cyclase (GGDEF)-like protein